MNVAALFGRRGSKKPLVMRRAMLLDHICVPHTCFQSITEMFMAEAVLHYNQCTQCRQYIFSCDLTYCNDYNL